MSKVKVLNGNSLFASGLNSIYRIQFELIHNSSYTDCGCCYVGIQQFFVLSANCSRVLAIWQTHVHENFEIGENSITFCLHLLRAILQLELEKSIDVNLTIFFTSAYCTMRMRDSINNVLESDFTLDLEL